MLDSEMNNNKIDQEVCGEETEDTPTLSAETLKALLEFYAENQADGEDKTKIVEDWQLSQFWYDKSTSETLAKEVLTLALQEPKKRFSIACVSCPTLFQYLHKYLREFKRHPELPSLDEETAQAIDIKVFEYDSRFNVYGQDFVFYDYKHPLGVSEDLSNYFDIVIADPPFLSEECHSKTGMTIRKVGKSGFKLIICTGAVMEELLADELNVKLSSFVPRHENNLANPFKCYVNYDPLFLNQISV